jgi:hypothetical protein
MSQNPAPPAVKGTAPTSADACMSIVHSLMHYRQGVEDRGESEQVITVVEIKSFNRYFLLHERAGGPNVATP